MTGVFISAVGTQGHREGQVRTVEPGVTQPRKAKGCWQLQRLGERHGSESPSDLTGGNNC